MEDATKGVSPVDGSPAAVETREDARKAAKAADDPHTSIYAKYDAIKAAREEAEATPAEEPTEEPPLEVKPEGTSATEEIPEAEPAKEPEAEELTPEEFAERFKNVKVKGKFAGEDAVVDAKTLLKIQGLERHLTKRLQEVARKEESLGAAAPIAPPPVDATYPPHVPVDKALRYWGENEVAAKYDEIFSESPYKAQVFLNTVQSERQKAQDESRKIRMDSAERDFFALNPEAEAPIKEFFSDPKVFSDPRISAAFERGDYYGALEMANVRIESKAIAKEKAAIKTAQDAALAEEKKKIDLKKKGSVIRTSSKSESKPLEEFRPPTPSEVIADEAARRRALMNR